jgi:hypothetical protein
MGVALKRSKCCKAKTVKKGNFDFCVICSPTFTTPCRVEYVSDCCEARIEIICAEVRYFVCSECGESGDFFE